MPERVTAKMRQAVAARARGYCEYCACLDCFSPQPFSVDHIFPKIKGGKTVLENLALICQGCNNHKYDKVEGLDAELQKYSPYIILVNKFGLSISRGVLIFSRFWG